MTHSTHSKVQLDRGVTLLPGEERRRSQRVIIIVPVTLELAKEGKVVKVAAHTVAVNTNGAMVICQRTLDPDAKVEIVNERTRERAIARDLLAELAARTSFLCDVGLGYLQLNRGAPTLSGGEAQRIRLAAQLGSNLQGVCYVLDEPTIGLHPRDNVALLDTLERLRAKGNTLVVVEHDEDTIRRADHVIDLGPGAGTRGGTSPT